MIEILDLDVPLITRLGDEAGRDEIPVDVAIEAGKFGVVVDFHGDE